MALTVDRPSGTTVELTIDNAKYFNLVLDDVMRLQSDMELSSMWSDDAAEQMKITIDTSVLASIYASISADNKAPPPGLSPTASILGSPAPLWWLTPPM